ncbi:hypothetical protein [Streptomyces sp. NP-1717]|uniref:hypothetical protein n=1 Tax=Streptomyces sp. NP-1717 TaxID=2704470 RepID=UPI001F5DB572|nr:hypothetical protein [Streptomyces sp. NP-1717]MCI3220862.1 hypothetical protein [Streptomyces sp. NP-1717]
MTYRIESDEALAELLHRAVESLRQRQGNGQADVELRGPLAEWLEDAEAGDDEGAISPYAVDAARAVLGDDRSPE